jgi:lycopene beta-cyclase
MEDATDFEYAIAGAGLSGLSLALELNKLNRKISADQNICLIEPRLEYDRDHTWCFWQDSTAKNSAKVTKSWHTWKVKHLAKTIINHSENYRYACTLANDYYDYALGQLKPSNKVSILLGEKLLNVSYSRSNIRLVTSHRTTSSRFLFDSRPPKLLDSEFKQDFFGWHLRASKSVFEDDCVTLMDFTEQRTGNGFHFFYVLPFTDKEALVESVWIGNQRLQKEEHEDLLVNYLLNEFGLVTFEQLASEHGCIPMHPISNESADQRHSFIGLAGGAARTSTGFAFSTIQKESQSIADSIEKNHWPEDIPKMSAKSKLLDKVLLAYLKKTPEDGPLLLSQLFEKTECDRLIRFLCDNSTFVDDAIVLSNMQNKLRLSATLAKIIFHRKLA